MAPNDIERRLESRTPQADRHQKKLGDPTGQCRAADHVQKRSPFQPDNPSGEQGGGDDENVQEHWSERRRGESVEDVEHRPDQRRRADQRHVRQHEGSEAQG